MNEENIEKVIQIIDNMKSEREDCGKLKFSVETRRLISEVAEYCRKTNVYDLAKKKEPEFIRKESAEYLYNHMINKGAEFPRFTTIAVIIMIPAIDDAIKGGRVDDN